MKHRGTTTRKAHLRRAPSGEITPVVRHPMHYWQGKSIKSPLSRRPEYKHILKDIRAMKFDDLSKRVIGCAIEVHRELGPGLLESAYGKCLLRVLRALRGKNNERERLGCG
jgi:hypothetical protein